MLKLKDAKPKVIGLGHVHAAIKMEEAGIIGQPSGICCVRKMGLGDQVRG